MKHNDGLVTTRRVDAAVAAGVTPSRMASALDASEDGERWAAKHDDAHPCEQCGRDMGYEWILGPVCGKCCRENHRRVAGGGKRRK